MKQRPLEKVLYAPIRSQNKAQQAAREAALERRRQASSIRLEKRRGPVR